MRAKAKVVVENSGAELIGLHVFTGKGKAKEARDCFIELVAEDIKEQAEASGRPCSYKEARSLAREEAMDGCNYTSASEDVDIVVMDAD
jgi:hypothetical protein